MNGKFDSFNISNDFKSKFNGNDENSLKTFKMFVDGELTGLNDETAEKVRKVMEIFDYDRRGLVFLANTLMSVANFRNISYIDLNDEDMYAKYDENFDIYCRNFDIVRYRGKYFFYNNVVKFVVCNVYKIEEDGSLVVNRDVLNGFRIPECPLFILKEGEKDVLSGKVIMKMRLSDEILKMNEENIKSDNPNPSMCINHMNFSDGVNILINVASIDGKSYVPFIDDNYTGQFKSDMKKKFEPVISYVEEFDGVTIKEAFDKGLFTDMNLAKKLVMNI